VIRPCGYDLDGIICPEVDLPFIIKRFDFAWRLIRSFQKPLFRPLSPLYPIVTGRPQRDAESTLKWLEKYGITNPVYFNQGDPTRLRDVVQTKINAIQVCDMYRFYESDPTQVNMLKQALPTVEIIWWNPKK
jgi:hypothetical protein